MCPDHTHLVRRLGDNSRDVPDPFPSFLIYKTGLISPFHGLYGDPHEATTGKGAVNWTEVKVKHC